MRRSATGGQHSLGFQSDGLMADVSRYETRRSAGAGGTVQPTSRSHQRRRHGEASRLTGCMSGQRSPTSVTQAPFSLSSRPPAVPAVNSRQSAHASKYHAPLSVYPDSVVSGACAFLPKTSSVDSGVDINSGGSSEKEDDRQQRSSPSADSLSVAPANCSSTRTRSRSSKSGRRRQVLTTSSSTDNQMEVSETVVHPDVGRDKTNCLRADRSDVNHQVEAAPKKDRKRSQSPAVLWRSISASSLVCSLSRRRSSSKTRATSGADTLNGRPKLPSADTDSDSENREMDRARRRRRIGGSSLPGTEHETPINLPSADSSSTTDVDRQSVSSAGQKAGSRRRGFFARSFRRTKSTPAEEFVLATTTDSDSTDVSCATLPRVRSNSRTGAVPDGSRSPGGWTLSGRAASWTSLRRSHTSESLSSAARGQQLQTGAPLDNGVYLVATLKLDDFMIGKLISGMALTDKHELVVVDLRSAYLIDPNTGRLIRTVGSKGSDRLTEPIGVATAPDGRVVFSDHVDQTAKVFSSRGHHIRTVEDLGLTNVGGVAVNRDSADVYVAGTDRRRVVVCRAAAGRSSGTVVPRSENVLSEGPLRAMFQHPYSLAVNPVTGDVIVGDDHTQTVTAVSSDGRSARWRWSPSQGDERPFFPSSICCDSVGHVFVADLYNAKVYMLNATGSSCSSGMPLLARGSGLRGGPAALAVDGRGQLYVADEERTVRVFYYRDVATTETVSNITLVGGGPTNQRLSYCAAVDLAGY